MNLIQLSQLHYLYYIYIIYNIYNINNLVIKNENIIKTNQYLTDKYANTLI